MCLQVEATNTAHQGKTSSLNSKNLLRPTFLKPPNTKPTTCSIPIPLYFSSRIKKNKDILNLQKNIDNINATQKVKEISLPLLLLLLSNSLWFVVQQIENESNRFDSAGNGSGCVGRSGPGQIGHGPEDHGWPISEVPKL